MIRFKKLSKRDTKKLTDIGHIDTAFEFIMHDEEKNTLLKGYLVCPKWNARFYSIIFEYGYKVEPTKAANFLYRYVKTDSDYRMRAITENWFFSDKYDFLVPFEK